MQREDSFGRVCCTPELHVGAISFWLDLRYREDSLKSVGAGFFFTCLLGRSARAHSGHRFVVKDLTRPDQEWGAFESSTHECNSGSC